MALVALSWLDGTTAQARDGEGRDDINDQIEHDTKQPEPDPQPIVAQPVWSMGIFGYIRGGYENVQKDAHRTYVGRNSGFQLESARLGFEGKNNPYHVSFRISIETASDSMTAVNTPKGTLETRARDAFLRVDPTLYFGVQVGQFRVPFSQEDLRGTPDLVFASRAVAQNGVLVGRGDQLLGIGVDREVGIMVSPDKPIKIAGDFAAAYYLSLYNGNTANQLLNDNSSIAFAGRGELVYGKIAQLGGAFLYNPRSSGVQPYAFEETDTQFAVDAQVSWKGLDLFAQLSERNTSFPTVGTADRKQLGYHAQIGYKIALPVPVMPAYRYAVYDPWSNAPRGSSIDKQRLQYHTFGIRVFHPKLPLSTYINYTVTVEEKPNRLDNNRLEILAQLLF